MKTAAEVVAWFMVMVLLVLGVLGLVNQFVHIMGAIR